MKKSNIEVGATYTTTNPNVPEVRVIAELSRDTDKNGRVIGELRGYNVQVCDGTYHAPMTIDAYGVFNDIDGCLAEQIAPALERYKPKFKTKKVY